MNKVLCLLPLLAATSVHAQSTPADFPAEATTPNAEALREGMADKVFAVKLADGSSWRLEYKSSGYWWINTSRGFSDTGKWSTQDGKLCAGGQRIKASCNEIRVNGKVLLLKRDNGEIVELAAQ